MALDDLWYEECVCEGGALTLGGLTVICPGCEHSPCAGFRPHAHQPEGAYMEYEYDNQDLYIA